MSHPARYSKEILDTVGGILRHEYPDWFGRPYIMDPFAGTGERLAALAAANEFGYTGIEIEASFIVANGIRHGDATDPTIYPPRPYIIFTSPAYPNGVSDHAVANDASKRYTYRKAVATIEGADRELHANNMGRYGYRGTKRGGTSKKRTEYWRIAGLAVDCWAQAELVIVNVSDFESGGETEPVVADWKRLLASRGWTNQVDFPVGTQRMRNGENGEKRVDHEMIVVARRESA